MDSYSGFIDQFWKLNIAIIAANISFKWNITGQYQPRPSPSL